jgi:hypothetical protein
VTLQRFVHALPIGIECLPVKNLTANEHDIRRHASTGFADRRDSALHEHAEILVALPVFAGLDICITVEPLDRLLERREFSQHDSLDALILIRVEHFEWSVPCEHIYILGVPRDLPVALKPRSVLHRLADINKIARHGVLSFKTHSAVSSDGRLHAGSRRNIDLAYGDLATHVARCERAAEGRTRSPGVRIGRPIVKVAERPD